MALSQWDLKYLSPQEQQEVLGYQSQWQGVDPTTRNSLNSAAEAIRARYGYSGGTSGNQYIPIDAPPQAPTIPQYQSPYTDTINDLMNQIKNPPKYKSPYEDLINNQLSDIMNRPKFSYDPDTDPAYQAFLQRATAAGDKAYADNLGGLSAMTGGRPNSWAGTVASQARNQYMLQAQEAVIQFEDRAYSRYRDETQDMYNLLGVLNSQDETAYSRYRDQIGDTKDLADMVLRLDDREFEQYKFMADQTWKRFDYEYQSFKDVLQSKKDKINEAIDRTNLLGYVNNQDSITLGVPSGTLSQSARERAEAMADYIKKQELDLVQFRKEKEISHEFDVKLLNAKGSSSGGSGSASSGSFTSTGGYVPSSSEAKTIQSAINELDKYVNSKEWNKMTKGQQWQYVGSYKDKILNNASSNLYGKNSLLIAEMILQQIEAHPIVSRLTDEYINAYNKVQQLHGSKNNVGPTGGRYAK